MIARTIAIFALMLISAGSTLAADKPLFSAKASTDNPVVSPDGTKSVSLRMLNPDAEDFPTEITVQSGRDILNSKINFGLNAEIIWSSDSNAFTVTGSSQGANGQYHTDAFIIKSRRLVRVPLTYLVELAFDHPVRCGWPEPPNVAAIQWLEGSRKVLLAAQIIDHSNCDSFGTFKGFAVDIQSLRVLKIYDQLAAKRLYGADLGIELKKAKDSCILKPESCFVSANHPNGHWAL